MLVWLSRRVQQSPPVGVEKQECAKEKGLPRASTLYGKEFRKEENDRSEGRKYREMVKITIFDGY